MPHPGKQLINNNSTGAWNSIDQDFVDNLRNVIVSLFAPNNLVKKKIFNKEVTASEFGEYATTFLRTYESEDLPRVDSIYASLSEKLMMKHVSELIKFYQEKMQQKVDFNRDNFEQALTDDHELVKSLTIIKFIETPQMGDEDMEEKHKAFLTEKIDEFYAEWNATVIEKYKKYTLDEKARKKIDEGEKLTVAAERAKWKVWRTGAFQIGYFTCKIATIGLHTCGGD